MSNRPLSEPTCTGGCPIVKGCAWDLLISFYQRYTQVCLLQ